MIYHEIFSVHNILCACVRNLTQTSQYSVHMCAELDPDLLKSQKYYLCIIFSVHMHEELHTDLLKSQIPYHISFIQTSSPMSHISSIKVNAFFNLQFRFFVLGLKETINMTGWQLLLLRTSLREQAPKIWGRKMLSTQFDKTMSGCRVASPGSGTRLVY